MEAITEILERNAREWPNDVALVEINPQELEKRNTTWREYSLIESSPIAAFRSEITWAEFDEQASTAWSRAAQWHGLEIIRTEKGQPGDQTGVVEFRATYTANNEFCNHHEVATFVKEADGWKFEDGELVGEKPMTREEPKVGRNDPCPCGSGKKYKKCCGQGK